MPIVRKPVLHEGVSHHALANVAKRVTSRAPPELLQFHIAVSVVDPKVTLVCSYPGLLE